MVTADGKITANEALYIGILKTTMLIGDIDSNSKSAKLTLTDIHALGKRLLEIMVILASSDGQIGIAEKKALLDFCYIIGGSFFKDFDMSLLFESVLVEIGNLNMAARAIRLAENGQLLHKNLPSHFNESLFLQFKKMVMADGKITTNEALYINILKSIMLSCPITDN